MLHDDLIESAKKTSPGAAVSLEKAVVFYTDFNLIDNEELIDTAYEFFKNRILPLPYERNLFIIKNAFVNSRNYADEHIIALVGEDENSLKAVGDYLGKKPRLAITLIVKQDGEFIVVGKMGIHDIYNTDGTPLCRVTKSGVVESDIGQLMRQTCRDVLAFCMILNTKYFEKKETTVDEKLNRARTKRGKLPLKNYVTVSLHHSEKSENGQSVGTHKSPIPHWRRGHIRKYTNGKIISIKPMIVNFDGVNTPNRKSYIGQK